MSSIEPTPPLILFQDEFLVAVDKAPGVPVQPDRTGDLSLLQELRSMFPNATVGSPHRLDRPVSGITLFTLTGPALRAMDALYREKRVVKSYLAIVEGRTELKGELQHQLVHAGGTRKAKVDKTGNEINARLKYTTKALGERFSLLEVIPEGGAFHQIRAQLGAAGHAIKGDVKYGARRGEPDRSIALHAWRMQFKHPITGQEMKLETPFPERSIWPALVALVKAW
ncbi:MAG: RluA family pseudouridine synthase [Flavobacteriales bacterium]